MRKTLVVNSGSSSLKFKLFSMPNFEEITDGVIDRIGINNSFLKMSFNGEKILIEQNISNHEEAISLMLEAFSKHNVITNLEDITKIGHRVVQGGELFKSSSLIDQEKLQLIRDLSKLAPLHNPANAQGIDVFMKLIPTAQNIAVFDTEYHQSIPEESYLYPVPYEWYSKYGVRRYGMHGTSHKYISTKISEYLNKDAKDIKFINLHLGNGASLAAIDGGVCLQTSMGLTPLAGIMMGTRSGDIDPSIIEYMHNQTGDDIKEITNILNKKSGLLGLSELSNDFRDIAKAIDEGNKRAEMALNVYTTRIVETIGAYYMRLKGLDALVFTAGIGENAPLVRQKVVNSLSFLGIELDVDANNSNSTIISTADSKIKVLIIPTDEEYQICKEAEQF